MHEAARELHREGDLRLAHYNRCLQPSRVLQISIRLARRKIAVLHHPLDRVGQTLETYQHLACMVEALGFLGSGGATHVSQIYNLP